MLERINHIIGAKKNKLIIVFICALITVIAVAIFQDYLHSKRNGSSFFFFESLLFKAVWFVFPPVLIYMKRVLKKYAPNKLMHLGLALVTATVVHLVIVPLAVWGLSTIFKEQPYGFVKVLTFTLANDLVKILLVYSVFLALLKYISVNKEKSDFHATYQIPKESSSECLTVSSGKENNLVKFKDILCIKSATPYVAVQIPHKQYLHASSLKSISGILDSRFVRIHRSTIVNTEKIVSYQSRLNGDYDLTLEDNSQLRLSRNYVKEFKDQFALSPQVKQ